MSHYTTEVRWIVENNSEEGTVLERCQEAAPVIFNFPYPIWDENDRLDLEAKILMAYYTREIGFETVGLWKLKLAAKLNNIMPYYVDLYKTTLLSFDPLNPTYMNENIQRGRESNGKDTQETTGNNSVKNSGSNTNTSTLNDFPQSNKSPTGDYATSTTTGVEELGAQVDTMVNNNATLNRTAQENEKIQNSRKGNLTGKTPSELIQSVRDAIINIDSLIIGELEDLFMQLW